MTHEIEHFEDFQMRTKVDKKIRFSKYVHDKETIEKRSTCWTVDFRQLKTTFY